MSVSLSACCDGSAASGGLLDEDDEEGANFGPSSISEQHPLSSIYGNVFAFISLFSSKLFFLVVCFLLALVVMQSGQTESDVLCAAASFCHHLSELNFQFNALLNESLLRHDTAL